MKVAFKTLGCRLNQLETDALVTDFHKAGFEVVPFGQKADVYVVNTCTVTNQSDQKSKNTINQAVRGKDADQGVLVVTGCMVTTQKEQLEQRDELTLVVENTKKHAILDMVLAHQRGETIQATDYKDNIFGFSVVEKGFHTRSSIKVQDGCNNHCTYCIVPKVRGRAKSRPYSEIEENIRKVISLGYKEIVLTGVNISRYHYDNLHFEDIVENILGIEGDFRVRISSIEPEGFTRKFIDLFNNPKLTPHLHMCLQSGSESVLKRMRRFYSLADYKQLIDAFRTQHPNFNFTTDIIVGFPGETEQEFKESCQVISEIGFSHIHTFKYSMRKSTIAENMPGHLPASVKNERSNIVRAIAEENKIKFRKKFIGQTQRVLIERATSNALFNGYGQHYLPIKIEGEHKLQKNNFYDVRISAIDDQNDYCLKAE